MARARARRHRLPGTRPRHGAQPAAHSARPRPVLVAGHPSPRGRANRCRHPRRAPPARRGSRPLSGCPKPPRTTTRSSRWPSAGDCFAPGSLLTTLVVEAAIHHLDLTVELAAADPPNSRRPVTYSLPEHPDAIFGRFAAPAPPGREDGLALAAAPGTVTLSSHRRQA